MRIFIDEFLTSGGLLGLPTWGDCDSLAREGAAMARAIAADFARLKGVEVHLKRDARLAELRFQGCRVHDVHDAAEDRAAFRRLAAEADWTLVIAPEIDGVLLDRCQQAVAAEGRLLGSDIDLIAWASDKHQTAELLGRQGIAVPAGITLEPGEPLPAAFAYPAVLKPRDGAGSMGVRLISDERQASEIVLDRRCRLERFCVGQPCSVSLLCGSSGAIPLPPFWQRLSVDGRFRYLGGERMQIVESVERAQSLALQAANSFPSAKGYVGVDLILGPDEDGSQDQVIEINPRLTTSYLGLRRSVRGNLAEALLAAAMGQSVRVEPNDEPIAFAANGSIESNFDSVPFAT